MAELACRAQAMQDYRGYALFDWVHPGLNVPAAYKDLSKK
jgi:cyclase